MLQLRLNVIKNLVGLVIALNLSDITYAQSNTCLIHDHNCIYHGIGRAAGVDPSQPNGINATANWDKENDFDLHSLLPQSETYSSPLEAINYPLQPTQPFFPTTDGSHIYPNHYSSTINDGGAIALHSGDDGGGVAIYPNQSGCINQTGIACENITVTGDEIPSGVYSYSLHAFSATGTEFESTNYNIDINSTGNIVLVMTEGDQTALTGVIQGAENQSETIDVFAINVGNSGHVGGVVLPQFPEISSLNELETAYQGTPNLFAEVYIPKLIEQNVLNNLHLSVAKKIQVQNLNNQVASKEALLAALKRTDNAPQIQFYPTPQTIIPSQANLETNTEIRLITVGNVTINTNQELSYSAIELINSIYETENQQILDNVYPDTFTNVYNLPSNVIHTINQEAQKLNPHERNRFKWEAASFAIGLTGIGEVPSIAIDASLSFDYAREGEWIDAGISAASIIPIVGYFGFAAKYGDNTANAIKYAVLGQNKSTRRLTSNIDVRQYWSTQNTFPTLMTRSLIDHNIATHILYGNATGGGHLWPGLKNKSPFPKGWTSDKILNVVQYIASDVEFVAQKQVKYNTLLKQARVDGVLVEVVIDPITNEVVTAYPASIPKNTW